MFTFGGVRWTFSALVGLNGKHGWVVGSPIYGGWVSYICKSHNLQKVSTSRWSQKNVKTGQIIFLTSHFYPKDEKSSSIDAASPNKSNCLKFQISLKILNLKWDKKIETYQHEALPRTMLVRGGQGCMKQDPLRDNVGQKLLRLEGDSALQWGKNVKITKTVFDF